MKIVYANIISAMFLIAAVILALKGIGGWGWLIVCALFTAHEYSFEKFDNNNE